MSGDFFFSPPHNWRCATGIWWVEPREAAEHPTMHRAFPQQRINQLEMPIVLRLQNSNLNSSGFLKNFFYVS